MKRKSVEFLRENFERSSYIKIKPPTKTSHPSWEIRFVARNGEELRKIRGCLRALGLRPGRVFSKVNRYCLPVYGKEQVKRFLNEVRPAKKGGVKNIS